MKPASASAKSIAFSPLQAAYYARLFSRWIASDAAHGQNIDALIEQRVRLGLTPATPIRAATPLPVVPAVIIGGGLPSNEVLRRCRAVRRQLLELGIVNELPLWALEGGVLQDLSD